MARKVKVGKETVEVNQDSSWLRPSAIVDQYWWHLGEMWRTRRELAALTQKFQGSGRGMPAMIIVGHLATFVKASLCALRSWRTEQAVAAKTFPRRT
jgi:hypothetical protein